MNQYVATVWVGRSQAESVGYCRESSPFVVTRTGSSTLYPAWKEIILNTYGLPYPPFVYVSSLNQKEYFLYRITYKGEDGEINWRYEFSEECRMGASGSLPPGVVVTEDPGTGEPSLESIGLG